LPQGPRWGLGGFQLFHSFFCPVARPGLPFFPGAPPPLLPPPLPPPTPNTNLDPHRFGLAPGFVFPGLRPFSRFAPLVVCLAPPLFSAFPTARPTRGPSHTGFRLGYRGDPSCPPPPPPYSPSFYIRTFETPPLTLAAPFSTNPHHPAQAPVVGFGQGPLGGGLEGQGGGAPCFHPPYLWRIPPPWGGTGPPHGRGVLGAGPPQKGPPVYPPPTWGGHIFWGPPFTAARTHGLSPPPGGPHPGLGCVPGAAFFSPPPFSSGPA